MSSVEEFSASGSADCTTALPYTPQKTELRFKIEGAFVVE
jgi:hypothetical protein